MIIDVNDSFYLDDYQRALTIEAFRLTIKSVLFPSYIKEISKINLNILATKYHDAQLTTNELSEYNSLF